MLRNSFVHLPGVGATTEAKLWERGIESWDELAAQADQIFKPTKAATIRENLARSEQALRERDSRYFYETLPRDELWRLVPEFVGDVAYLDIESTGLGLPPDSESTTITLYWRGEVRQEFEHTRKRALLEEVFSQCRLLVSFFGEGFDVPFLRKEFQLPLDVAHLDLCFWLRRLGYAGGLKKIQKLFSDIPARESMDIDGYDAVRLWRLHLKGVPRALETLLAYNAEDTIVLEPLLVRAFNEQRLKVSPACPAAISPLETRAIPSAPTRVCSEVYGLLRGLSNQAGEARSSFDALTGL